MSDGRIDWKRYADHGWECCGVALSRLKAMAYNEGLRTSAFALESVAKVEARANEIQDYSIEGGAVDWKAIATELVSQLRAEVAEVGMKADDPAKVAIARYDAAVAKEDG